MLHGALDHERRVDVFQAAGKRSGVRGADALHRFHAAMLPQHGRKRATGGARRLVGETRLPLVSATPGAAGTHQAGDVVVTAGRPLPLSQ